MKSQSGMKSFFGRTGTFIFLSILLFACTTSPATPQSQVVKPTKAKTSPTLSTSPAPNNSPAPSTPENNNNPTKTFSIQNANKLAPADVLKEVKFNVAGGGFGCGPDMPSHPTITLTEVDDPEWMATIGAASCGWNVDELVQMTLSLPNGKSIVEELQAQKDDYGNYNVWYTHMPKLGDPAGIYSIKFSGNSGTVEEKINIIIPNEPRLYYIHDIKSLFLYSFHPDEKVRLFLYGSNVSNSSYTLSFMGWQEYQTDSLGQLLVGVVDAGFDTEEYGVVGDKSGMVNRSGNYVVDPAIYINFFDQNQIQGNTSDSNCPGALPSRLEAGKYAYVSTDPPLDNRVREDAGTNYAIIGYIGAGSAMEILDGPKCADGWNWWKIRSTGNSSLVGWTAEGDDAYWIIPCDSPSSCP